ncbi:MAG TPA: preprotein translocase subunit SecG [Tepidisphaeraceae bacterium]|jgi:preprotein translocase subunit SecG|nr:preprotein translocase subunit SecG [Tepidisphaeraceae bacterium]
MLTFWYYTLICLFIFICIVLMMLVLVQKGRGGGLSGAFGGGGGGHTPFGTKTGDVLTWATSILFGVFLMLAIGLNWVSNKRQDMADKEKTAINTVVPVHGSGK